VQHRQSLFERNGERIRVRARIEEYGTNGQESVYLLIDVRDAASCELLTDHLWMPIGTWARGMRQGDIIEFDATVAPYVKGYFGQRQDVLRARRLPSVDYHLEDPTNAEVIVQGPIPRVT
jgi:hypothetical protein